jgi:acyl carrier protein
MSEVDRSAIESQVRDYLKSRFAGFDESLPADASLESVVDSLGVFDVVEWVEGSFSVRIPNEEFSPQRFSSVGAICQTIEEFR